MLTAPVVPYFGILISGSSQVTECSWGGVLGSVCNVGFEKRAFQVIRIANDPPGVIPVGPVAITMNLPQETSLGSLPLPSPLSPTVYFAPLYLFRIVIGRLKLDSLQPGRANILRFPS